MKISHILLVTLLIGLAGLGTVAELQLRTNADLLARLRHQASLGQFGVERLLIDQYLFPPRNCRSLFFGSSALRDALPFSIHEASSSVVVILRGGNPLDWQLLEEKFPNLISGCHRIVIAIHPIEMMRNGFSDATIAGFRGLDSEQERLLDLAQPGLKFVGWLGLNSQIFGLRRLIFLHVVNGLLPAQFRFPYRHYSGQSIPFIAQLNRGAPYKWNEVSNRRVQKIVRLVHSQELSKVQIVFLPVHPQFWIQLSDQRSKIAFDQFKRIVPQANKTDLPNGVIEDYSDPVHLNAQGRRRLFSFWQQWL